MNPTECEQSHPIRSRGDENMELLKRIEALEAALQKVQETTLANPIEKQIPHENATTIPEANAGVDKTQSSKAPSQTNCATVLPQDAPAGDPTSKRGIRYINITYDDDDKRGEEEVDEAAASQSSSINSVDKSVQYKVTFKYDTRAKTNEVYFDDPGMEALVVLATRHLRLTTEDELKTLPSPFCDFVYSWDNLVDLSELKEESLIVKELHEKIEITSTKSSPYGSHLSGLHRLKDPARLTDTAKDLKHLLVKIKETRSMQPYFHEDKNPHAGSKKVHWPWIWTLYVPGELVIYTHPKDPKRSQIMIVRWDNQYESILSDEDDDDATYEVPCWAYDWDPDERLFKLVSVNVAIKRFHEAKAVTNLDIFPLKFLDTAERQTRMQKFIERGKRFHEICTGPQRLICNGKILPRTRGNRQDWSFADDDAGGKSRTPSIAVKDERVMVDFEAYLQYCPTDHSHIPMGDLQPAFILPRTGSSIKDNDAIVRNQRLDYHDCKPQSEHVVWKDEQFALLPGRVVGYQLKRKCWCEFQLDDLKEIPPEQQHDHGPFNQLQLERKSKDLIKSLIQCHQTRAQRAQRGARKAIPDFVRNKGDGLVILLHGEPGTGKTFTAESLAATTGRAMYSLGPSDLGTDPRYIEAILELHFMVAAKWNAIILFDEADVFLEQRRGNDTSLDRNVVVSILLRVLEYYDGILILTTNRIKAIDSAIVSRVTVAVLYQKLDDRAKKNIFRNLVDQFENSRNRDKLTRWIDHDEWENQFDRFPLGELNGRQIRNLLSATSTLAGQKDDSKDIVEHLHTVIEVVTRFQKQAKYWQEESAKKAGLQDA